MFWIHECIILVLTLTHPFPNFPFFFSSQRFDLALQLKDLRIAYELASSSDVSVCLVCFIGASLSEPERAPH